MARLCIPILFFFGCLNFAFAGEAEDARQKGIAALKESQTEPAKIVEAARSFSKAAGLYEAAGNTELAVEMNSYLYWCKKKMTAADIDEFLKDNKAAARLNAAQKAPELSEAQKWFDRADSFARMNPNEHLLIAIRFFEVADRFKGSDVSLKAQDRSLQEMQANMRPQAPGALPGVAPSYRERHIKIDANAPFGYGIGPFKKGESFVLFYESGTWRTPADNTEYRPDTPDCPEHLRVALAQIDKQKSLLTYHGIVGGGSVKRGIQFVADRDWEFLVLRINHQVPDISRNTGAVAYRLLVSPGIGEPPDMSTFEVAPKQPQQPTAPPPQPVAKKVEPEKPVVRVDIPAAAKIKDAEKSLREIFKEELASTQAAVKAGLAAKLLKEAANTNDDPALKYALCREARDTAAAAANAGVALLAHEMLLKHFNVNRLDETSATFKKLNDTCKSREASRELAEAAALRIEQALAAEEPEIAKAIASAVEPAAVRIGDTELINRIKELGAKAAENQREQAASKAFLDKIAANPTDPAANLAAGRHFCFVKGDWVRGLPALAKGSQPELKALAEKELVDPQEPTAVAAVGDAWFESAEKNAAQRAVIMAHAAELYARALPGLTGVTRIKTEKRLAAAQVLAVQAPTGPLPKNDSFELPNGIRLDAVLVSPGKFNMGSTGHTSAMPIHAVTITKAFYLGKFEVTQEQWEAVMGANPSTYKSPRHPVEGATWSDARDFCARLSQVIRRKVRLPSEAEWEFACRAGTSTRYYTGESIADLDRAGWFQARADAKASSTYDVGMKVPNSLGLFDMHGNVYEMCEDAYQPTYANAPTTDPLIAKEEAEHVIRGGCYSTAENFCTSANRTGMPMGAKFTNVGFRVVVEPPGSFVAPAPPPAAAVAAAAAPTGPATLARAAIPNDAGRQATLTRVRERNKADYEKEATPEGKIDLVIKLLLLRDKDKETRYAVLREALRLSIAAGDGKLAVDAVNGLDQHFEGIDSFKEKLAALKLAAANAGSESAIQSTGLAMARCVDEFAANGRFEVLKEYADLIGTFAAKMKDPAALKDALRNAERLNEAWPAVQSALKKLQTASDDPQANLLAGQYLCFRRSEWQTGLAALAKSPDKTLKRLAELEMLRPGNPAVLKSLADEWWEISNTFTSFEQARIRAHAAGLYQQARRKLPEAERAAIQTRIQEFIASQIDFGRITAERREPGKSGRAGSDSGTDFKELSKTPRLLVGVRVSTSPNIRSIQAIYVSAQGVKEEGPVFGAVSGKTIDVVAAPGYAVAGIISTTTQVLQGFRIVFMRVNGQVLDPTDRYESPWVGDTAGQEARHETGANLGVGIYGKSGVNIDAVGFYSHR